MASRIEKGMARARPFSRTAAFAYQTPMEFGDRSLIGCQGGAAVEVSWMPRAVKPSTSLAA
ncbi:hypothetical protein W824_08695 [Clavibacter cf. michiganensis LMG 26808]|nr:hypothetical protein W824_08695 [Clavibacter cf. michiganensis LMG 26808]